MPKMDFSTKKKIFLHRVQRIFPNLPWDTKWIMNVSRKQISCGEGGGFFFKTFHRTRNIC